MGSRAWIVDGSHASARAFEAAARSATRIRRFRRTPRMFAGSLSEATARELSASGFRLYPDIQLDPFPNQEDFARFCSSVHAPQPGLNQVVELINAPLAWKRATGEEVYIAVVDSGINGTHPEFPPWKSAGGWSYDATDPWTDWLGHGTMCAAIAAASPESHARLCGVAPGANLYSCKTDFSISTIIDAYEWIEDQHEAHQHPVVVTNSFGFDLDTPPEIEGQPVQQDHPLAVVIKRVVASGIPMVFAAGNSHPVDAKQCSPNSIWAWNSMRDVFTVAEVDENLIVRPSSSRGPGQWADASSAKPDCSAPTFGWILYGNSYGKADDGWGSSGAAPQAAGLLAMLLQQRPDMAPADLYMRIRDTSRALPSPWHCTGSGLLDCDAAVF